LVEKIDGSNPQVLGGEGEYPWASWGPDGAQIACLGSSPALRKSEPQDKRGVLLPLPKGWKPHWGLPKFS
jgi:hypothetical protein